MAAVFGIGSNSLFNVITILGNRYGRRRVVLLTRQLARLQRQGYQRRLARAKLLVAASLREMQLNRILLNTLATPLLVFDNPAMLEAHGIPLLDADDAGSQLLRKFQVSQLDYAKLFDTIEQRQRVPHNIQHRKVDLLPQIIQQHTISGFMDKFNTFMYAITTAHNRGTLRPILVRWVFGQISSEEFDRQLMLNGVKISSKIKPLYQETADYLASEKGAILRQALREALQMEAAGNQSARRTVRYNEICEKYSVDRFDLRNLILLHRNSQKD